MNVIVLIISFVVFIIVDDLLIKYEVKKNPKLFYDIHLERVIKAIRKSENND